MPYSIIWTYQQLIEMRIAAIELLRMMNRRSNLRRYSSDIWQFWVSTHGMPQPGNWDEVQDYRHFVLEYMERLLAAIDWHAFLGRASTSTRRRRIRRIRQLSNSVDRDIAILQRSGVDPTSPATIVRPGPGYNPRRRWALD